MSGRWSEEEAIVRWLEHETANAERRVEDLAVGIGLFEQQVHLIRTRGHRTAPPPPIILSVTVTGCGGFLVPGVDIQATRSSITYTGTTDAFGVANVVVPAGGTYAVSTNGTGYNLTTGDVVVASSGTTTASRSLSAAPGYACLDWESGGSGSRQCGVFPTSRTFTLTDSIIGTITLSYGAIIGMVGNGWVGTKSYAWPTCGACTGRTFNVSYQMKETATAGAALSIGYAIFGGCPNPLAAGPNNFISGTCAAVDFNCVPFAAEFAVTHAQLYCGATATITITD